MTNEQILEDAKAIDAIDESQPRTIEQRLIGLRAYIRSNTGYHASLIDEVIAELTKARANHWIDCSVELPDYESVKQKRLRVVVFWPETNSVFTLWYGHRFGYNSPSFFEEYEWTESDLGEIDENDNPFLGESLTYSGITHWQPLPLPPNAQQERN